MQPIRILLTNDDGINSRWLCRLLDGLRTDGHQVVVSAPLRDCTGASASFDYFTPHDVRCVDGDTSVWSVDGSPVVATLYGLDVLGRQRPFDLVLSGPNKGWNLGHFTSFSGTVAAAWMALRRGVPALAVSLAHDELDAELPVALVSELVRELIVTRSSPGALLLPRGIGANINLPRSEDLIGIAFTRIGDWSPYHFGFVEQMDRHSLPSLPLPAAPGLALLNADEQPDAFAGQPTEGRMVLRGHVTISALNTGTLSDAEATAVLRTRLQGFAIEGLHTSPVAAAAPAG